MYGIADLDNCYCSCEKVFRPDLEGKPIVVLSNNDGCVVARSNEAKKMGIKEGTPPWSEDSRVLLELRALRRTDRPCSEHHPPRDPSLFPLLD